MADPGYSVFAPYARVPPNNGLAGGARGDQVTIRIDEPQCDHRLQLALPPQLVKRPAPARTEDQEDPSTRRTKIWEFSQNLHCSIIGTCLSTGELRQTLTRAGQARTDSTDHEMHHKAVSLAAKHDQAAKLLRQQEAFHQAVVTRDVCILFPVDCVSHDAALTVKRLSRQADKRFVPLRSASATSCLAAPRPLALRGAESAV